MLKLGGLENSLSNTTPSPNKFKIANNVSFNKDGFLTPRYPLAQEVSSFLKYYSLITTYGSSLYPFYFGVNSSDYHTAQLGGVAGYSDIPGAGNLGYNGTSFPNNNFSDQSFELNRVRYVLAGAGTLYSRIYKFDGFEIYNAGLPSPYIVPSPEPTGAAGYSSTGSRFVRVMNNTIDMQGNSVASDTIKYRTNGTTQNFNAIAFGNNMFVGVGDRGISYSYDGILWDSAGRCVFTNSAGTVINSFPLGSVTYGTVGGNPLFVAASNSTSVEYGIVISSDGINWRQVALTFAFTSQAWQGVAFGNGVFVAVNNTASGVGNRITWSNDGETWNFSTVPNLNTLTCVAFGNGVFVALANSGVGNRCMTSTDGSLWTARTTPVDNNWKSLVYGNGTWVAVATNGTTANQVMTNPSPGSGTLWLVRATSALNTWTSITFGTDGTTNFFVAVAAAAATANKVMRSADNGATWTLYAGINAIASACICFGAPVIGTSTNRIFVIGALDATADTTLNLSYTLYPPTGVWVQGESPITTRISITETQANVDAFYRAAGNPTLYYEVGNGNNDYLFYGTLTYTGSFFTTNILDPSSNPWGTAYVGEVGSYLVRTVNVTDNNKMYSAFAYKVRTVSPLTFEGAVLGFNNSTLLWETLSFTATPSLTAGTIIASKRFCTVWASSSDTGVYYFKGMFNSSSMYLPIIGSATAPKYAFNVDIRSTVLANRVQLASSEPFQISGTLNDWYDVFSSKVSFNSLAGKELIVSMTNYLDSLVIATDDLLYFSDPTLGGSIEMSSALSFAKIGDSEKGKITSIVGTKDYLIVSRERKVYMVAGSLSTQNYRVQEIPGLSLGAYSNSCMIEVDGNIMILTANGAWMINAANASQLSEGIGLNFKSFFPTYLPVLPLAEQNSITFSMTNYPATAWGNSSYKNGNFISSMYDPFKRIVVFTDNSYGTTCGKSLVFHLNNNEWTTWDSYSPTSLPNCQITAMGSVNGVIYLASSQNIVTGLGGAFVYRENPNFGTSVTTYEYAERSPPKLSTTWISAGEPSLEKQLLQLKIYGYLFGDLLIKHYQNWDLTTAITNATFTPVSNYTYFHKKRLNSSKVLSTSIEISIPSTGKAFWIEGIEVEFESIQAGMKR